MLDGAIGASDTPLTFVCLFVVALVTGLLGMCFVLAYKRATEIRARMPYWAGPIVGAAVCTGCALALRHEGVLGSGAPILESLLKDPAGISLVLCLALVVGKSLATIGVIGGGANAGLTTPLLVVGGLMGAVCVHLSGLQGLAAQSLVVCGSAAMVSAVLNVPIATVAICVELFGVSAAVPAALGAAIGFMVAKTEVVYSYSKA